MGDNKRCVKSLIVFTESQATLRGVHHHFYILFLALDAWQWAQTYSQKFGRHIPYELTKALHKTYGVSTDAPHSKILTYVINLTFLLLSAARPKRSKFMHIWPSQGPVQSELDCEATNSNCRWSKRHFLAVWHECQTACSGENPSLSVLAMEMTSFRFHAAFVANGMQLEKCSLNISSHQYIGWVHGCVGYEKRKERS